MGRKRVRFTLFLCSIEAKTDQSLPCRNNGSVVLFIADRATKGGDLFEGLEIWGDEEYRQLQGTYPVVFLSFAGIKQTTYDHTKFAVNRLFTNLYNQYEWLLKDDRYTETDRRFFQKVTEEMPDPVAADVINQLCEWLYRYYGKKCIVLLDKEGAVFQCSAS